MEELHILNQLYYARSEFQRGFKSVGEEDSQRRVMPMISFAWIERHLAWLEQLAGINAPRGSFHSRS